RNSDRVAIAISSILPGGMAEERRRLPAFPAVASAPAAATAASAAVRLWTSFVDVHGSAVEIRAVESIDRFFPFGIVGHLDETKSAGLPRISIGNDVHAAYDAVSFKEGPDCVFGRPKTQVPHKDVFHNVFPLLI